MSHLTDEGMLMLFSRETMLNIVQLPQGVFENAVLTQSHFPELTLQYMIILHCISNDLK